MRSPPRLLLSTVVAGSSLLACSGAFTRDVKPHAYRALSLPLIEGDVQTETDGGVNGTVTVNASGLVQSASWMPAGDIEGEALLSNAWDSSRTAMLAELKGKGDIPVAMPSLSTSMVAGTRALTWEWEGAGLNYLTATSWECPVSGVRVLLVSGGLPFGAKETHSKSLTGVTCANAAVALTEADQAYLFTGPSPTWSQLPADTAGMQMWAVADRTSVLVLQSSVSFLGDAADRKANCHTVADKAKSGLGADYAVDALTIRVTDTPDGCAEELEAFSTAQSSKARFRTIIRECSSSQTVVASCISFDPSFTMLQCDALFTCKAAGATP